MFSGTLRFNLDPAGLHSDGHIMECVRSADMADLVEQFPAGLDFDIDSDGSGLSEGEKQLICCIRALLSEC